MLYQLSYSRLSGAKVAFLCKKFTTSKHFLLPWPDVVCCISDLLIESRTVNCRQTGEPLALGLMRMYPDLPFWPDRHLFQLMKYLYYKLYHSLKRVKTNDTPATNAMILLSMIHTANVATVQILLNHFFSIKIKLVSKDEIIVFAISLGLVLYAINYFQLYKKREEIYEKYKNESKQQSRIGYAILILYAIGSATILYIVGSNYPL